MTSSLTSPLLAITSIFARPAFLCSHSDWLPFSHTSPFRTPPPCLLRDVGHTHPQHKHAPNPPNTLAALLFVCCCCCCSVSLWPDDGCTIRRIAAVDLPPLPHSYRRSFDASRLTRRRRSIQQFLQVALEHRALRECDALVDFLSPEGGKLERERLLLVVVVVAVIVAVAAIVVILQCFY